MQVVDGHTQSQKSAGDHSGLLKIISVTGCPRMRKLRKSCSTLLFTYSQQQSRRQQDWGVNGLEEDVRKILTFKIQVASQRGPPRGNTKGSGQDVAT